METTPSTHLLASVGHLVQTNDIDEANAKLAEGWLVLAVAIRDGETIVTLGLPTHGRMERVKLRATFAGLKPHRSLYLSADE